MFSGIGRLWSGLTWIHLMGPSISHEPPLNISSGNACQQANQLPLDAPAFLLPFMCSLLLAILLFVVKFGGHWIQSTFFMIIFLGENGSLRKCFAHQMNEAKIMKEIFQMCYARLVSYRIVTALSRQMRARAIFEFRGLCVCMLRLSPQTVFINSQC